MKFTHYKTRTNEILLEKNTMAKLIERSYEETKEKYKNARFIIFTPKRSKKHTAQPPEAKAEKKEELSRKESNGK